MDINTNWLDNALLIGIMLSVLTVVVLVIIQI